MNGKNGALAWWMDSLMNEGDRLKKKIEPPNPNAWNEDMYRQRMFTVDPRTGERVMFEEADYQRELSVTERLAAENCKG